CSKYRCVYLLPTWSPLPLEPLRSQSPGVHDQGETSWTLKRHSSRLTTQAWSRPLGRGRTRTCRHCKQSTPTAELQLVAIPRARHEPAHGLHPWAQKTSQGWHLVA